MQILYIRYYHRHSGRQLLNPVSHRAYDVYNQTRTVSATVSTVA